MNRIDLLADDLDPLIEDFSTAIHQALIDTHSDECFDINRVMIRMKERGLEVRRIAPSGDATSGIALP